MKKTTQLAGYKATVSRVRTLLLRERVVSGTLNVQTVGNARRYTLTDKVEGKTRWTRWRGRPDACTSPCRWRRKSAGTRRTGGG